MKYLFLTKKKQNSMTKNKVEIKIQQQTTTKIRTINFMFLNKFG